jgi:hypothetical protein
MQMREMQSSPLKVPCRVKWAYAEVTEIPRCRDEEIDTIWFNKTDYQKIKKGLLETVKFMSCKNPIEKSSEKHCARGLEGRTLRGSCDRLKNKVEVVNAVLLEQDMQRNEGINDSEDIADASCSVSYRSVQAALRFGHQDEQAVLEYLKEATATKEHADGPRKRIKISSSGLKASVQNLLRRRRSSPAVA